MTIGLYSYYVPLSSPKESDYTHKETKKIIRKSIIPIIRIVVKDKYGNPELKGTLKVSNMIPVPPGAITYYDISKESDSNYKILVKKEYEFIKKNKNMILKNATVLYNQKTKESSLFLDSKKKPGYLATVVDFKYAEQMHDRYLNK